MGAFLARFRPRRLGLRARITLTFTLGAFALSLLLAATTYGLTRSTLVRQRDTSILRQAYQNARITQNELESDPTSVQGVLARLQTPTSSRPDPVLPRRVDAAHLRVRRVGHPRGAASSGCATTPCPPA